MVYLLTTLCTLSSFIRSEGTRALDTGSSLSIESPPSSGAGYGVDYADRFTTLKCWAGTEPEKIDTEIYGDQEREVEFLEPSKKEISPLEASRLDPPPFDEAWIQDHGFEWTPIDTDKIMTMARVWYEAFPFTNQEDMVALRRMLQPPTTTKEIFFQQHLTFLDPKVIRFLSHLSDLQTVTIPHYRGERLDVSDLPEGTKIILKKGTENLTFVKLPHRGTPFDYPRGAFSKRVHVSYLDGSPSITLRDRAYWTGSLDENENGRHYSLDTGQPIVCRHISTLVAQGGEKDTPLPRVDMIKDVLGEKGEKLKTYQKIDDLSTKIISQSVGNHLVGQDQWGVFSADVLTDLKAQLNALEPDQQRKGLQKQYMLLTPYHAMLVRFKIRKDGDKLRCDMIAEIRKIQCTKVGDRFIYSVNQYDPNISYQERRLTTEDLDFLQSRKDIVRWFVPGDALGLYCGETDSETAPSGCATVFIQLPDQIAWDTIGTRPEERFVQSWGDIDFTDSNVVFSLTSTNLLHLIPEASLERIFSADGLPQDSPQLWDRLKINKESEWTFYIALLNGHEQAIRHHMKGLQKLYKEGKISEKKLVEILIAMDKEGIPGFYLSLQNGNKRTVQVFMEELGEFDLRDSALKKILIAQTDHGLPGFAMPFGIGNTDIIKIYMQNLRKLYQNKKISEKNLVEILMAIDKEGIPGFYMAFEQRHPHAIHVFMKELRELGLSEPALKKILLTHVDGLPFYYIASLQGYTEVIRTYLKELENFDISREVFIEIIREARRAMMIAQKKGHTKTVDAFNKGLKDLSSKVHHIT